MKKPQKFILDLRKTSQNSGSSRRDDMNLLSERDEPVGSSKEETTSYRSTGGSEIAGILHKSSIGNEIRSPAGSPKKIFVPPPASNVGSKPRPRGSPTLHRPHPSMVWPQRITAIPRNIAAEIPVFHVLAYDLFFVTIIGVLSVVTPWVNWIFVVYGIFALILRASSQRMFSSALMSLLIIPLATLLKRTALADIFAVMTFYFLLIGLIVAVIELKKKH